MAKIQKIVQDPLRILRKILVVGNFNWMPDKTYLKLMYFAHFGKKLNLNEPKTFNEKLQWLKLYNRKPEYTDMVDKYEAKRYAAERIGEEYIIPTLGVWEHSEDIDFDMLPEQFVLKCTHDCGSIIVCKDKSKFDQVAAREKLKANLSKGYFYWGREWPYKNVKPRIIAEQYMEDVATKELRDYKWYCFSGEPKLLGIFCGRSQQNVKINFFDMNMLPQHISWGYPCSEEIPALPVNFEKMKQLARQLAKGTPMLRIDFYEANGNIYFGEMTFFDGSGFDKFSPSEWDRVLGSWISLPRE